MPVKDIIHVAIKTMDLEATNKFYIEVLGLKFAPFRPKMDVPGSWIDFDKTQIHVLAGEKAYGETDIKAYGSGTIDHIAVLAVGYDEMRERFIKHGCPYRQNDIKDAGLWQLFVRDPSGVVVELNFRVADEPPGAKGPDGTHPYRFGYF